MPLPVELDAWVQGQTITQWLRDGVRERGDLAALRSRRLDGQWRTTSWAELGDGAARFAGGLRRLGVGPGDAVLLFLRNRPEFHTADLQDS